MLFKVKTVPGKPSQLRVGCKLGQLIGNGLGNWFGTNSDRSYNLTISYSSKVLWFRVAKVGTRTVLGHLKKEAVCLEAEHPYHVRYRAKNFTNFFRFAFVRNPWDRLVSAWLNKVVNSNHFGFAPESLKKYQDFANFVDYLSSVNVESCDSHLKLQSRLVDLGNVDFLGRFETFAKDFVHVCKQIGISSQGVEAKNVSHGRKDYRKYYSGELVEAVGEIYSRDIQIFGYDYDSD